MRDSILRILAGQSPGYHAWPDASAFVAEGLDDASAVAEELEAMKVDGLVEQETIYPPEDENGFTPDPYFGGYAITDAGRALLNAEA